MELRPNQSSSELLGGRMMREPAIQDDRYTALPLYPHTPEGATRLVRILQEDFGLSRQDITVLQAPNSIEVQARGPLTDLPVRHAHRILSYFDQRQFKPKRRRTNHERRYWTWIDDRIASWQTHGPALFQEDVPGVDGSLILDALEQEDPYEAMPDKARTWLHERALREEFPPVDLKRSKHDPLLLMPGGDVRVVD